MGPTARQRGNGMSPTRGVRLETTRPGLTDPPTDERSGRRRQRATSPVRIAGGGTGAAEFGIAVLSWRESNKFEFMIG